MTELIWQGKYVDGKKCVPLRVSPPFQAIETVNESVKERQRMLDFSSNADSEPWRNRLVWGDKKYVLPSLLREFARSVKLIYIDPPFGTGADFAFPVTIPGGPRSADKAVDTFVKEPSILEKKAYRDTWGELAHEWRMPWRRLNRATWRMKAKLRGQLRAIRQLPKS